MKVSAILPHLKKYGGVRRYIQFGKELVNKGIPYTLYVGDISDTSFAEQLGFTGSIKPLSDISNSTEDVIICGDAGSLKYLDESPARLKVVNVIFPPDSNYLLGNYGQYLSNPEYLVVGNSKDWNGTLTWQDNWFTIPGAVDFSLFKPVLYGKEGFSVLFFAKNRPWKGKEYILKAVDALHSTFKDIRFGYFDSEVHSDIPDYITPHINVPQEEMHKVYGDYSVFLSMEELAGWQNTVAEAMACTCACVTTAIGTKDFAINKETALIINQKDSLQAISAIASLKNDHNLSSTIAINGHNIIQNFSWKHYTENWIVLLQQKLASTTPKKVVVEKPKRRLSQEIEKQILGVREQANMKDSTQTVEEVASFMDITNKVFSEATKVEEPKLEISTISTDGVITDDKEFFAAIAAPMNTPTVIESKSKRELYLEERRKDYSYSLPSHLKEFDKYEKFGAYHWNSKDAVYIEYVQTLASVFSKLKAIHGEGEVLDIGSGDGYIASRLAADFKVRMIEPNQVAKKLAAEKLGSLMGETITFSSYDSYLDEVDIPKFVLLSQVIEHFEDDSEFVKWVASKQPRVVVVSTPIAKKEGMWDPNYHYREYSTKQFKELFSSLKGYSVTQVTQDIYNQIIVLENRRECLVEYLKESELATLHDLKYVALSEKEISEIVDTVFNIFS